MRPCITPVILCGGAGTRLWPLSTPDHPKQLLKLGEQRTLLQQTVLRITDRSRFSAPIVVAAAAQVEAIEAQLMEIGCIGARVIAEPMSRGTAAAIALAALEVSEALLLIMPSDHVIEDVAPLQDAIDRSIPAAQDGWLVTFGITAEQAETGFGYIKVGDALAEGVHRAGEFVEKPLPAAAERMFQDGNYVWNSGLFLFRAKSILEALSRHAPASMASVETAFAQAQRSSTIIEPDPARFGELSATSIDVAVMEKATRVAVTPVSMGWSDVGSWDAVHQLGPADADGNVVAGDAILLDVSNCLVRSDGPTVAALGVSNLIVVATDGHLLILPRGRSQDVRALVDALHDRKSCS